MKLIIPIIIGALLLSTGVLAIEPLNTEEQVQPVQDVGKIATSDVIIEIPQLELTIEEQIKILLSRWIERIKEYQEMRKEIEELTVYINELLSQQEKSVKEILNGMGVEIKKGKEIKE